MIPELTDTVSLEAEVLAFWKAERIFQRTLAKNAGKKTWVFYEGPPTANGTPHNGHVLTRAIKDLFPRYRTMRGYNVPRKAGWDTHGLPVEVEVEKQLGIHGHEAIENYGLEDFAQRCIESVFKYTSEWEDLTDRIGFWVDLPDAYVTYHRSFVESVWWALSQLHKKGLLYRGHKVVWWWPAGGTALSAGEVGMGYKTVDDPSIVIRFPVEGQENTSMLAWTTTPWTLPSNCALAVKADAQYVRVKHGDEFLIAAADLAEALIPEGEVVETFLGETLVGTKYQAPFDFAEPEEGIAHQVIVGDFVTLDTGTGIVHCAPAFGEDDFRVAKENGIGMLQLIGPDGKFVAGTGAFEGMFCKDADKHIIRDLKERGVLYKHETYRHDYPYCWRADNDPLIQYARPAWFIRTTALNEEVLANNAAVNWLPTHIKEGRFGDFLRNNVDWALSRERFWGTPLNIWVCDDCEHEFAPASSKEVEALAPGAFDDSVDSHLQIHRPWVDRISLPCEHCGGKMHRVPEVIDCWFDSGCMPFAQHGWPHKNAALFQQMYPADFISEAVDQTRGWFYSLMMIATLLFDEETAKAHGVDAPGLPRPYETCIVLGHVCDMDGKKESKSKGNYLPPDLVMTGRMRFNVHPDASLERGALGMMAAQVRSLDLSSGETLTAGSGPDADRHAVKIVKVKVARKETVHIHPDDIAEWGIGDQVTLFAPFAPPGADAFRWLFYVSNPPWSNTRLSLRAIRDYQRDFLLRLRNVHQFFAIYANIAEFDPTQATPRPVAERHLLDRWIHHELDALTEAVITDMDRYHLYEAARAIAGFCDGLSNWYVRRSRRRFWGEGDDLQDALWTLHEVLVKLSKLIAPFVPFLSEAMYRSLVFEPFASKGRADDVQMSVHMCDYPDPDATLRAPELAEDMALVRELASLGLSARAGVGVRVRQPLRAAEVVLAEPDRAARLSPLLSLLEDELNVREIRFTADAEQFVTFQVKPNFRVLGKRLGKDMKACAAAIGQMPGDEVRRQLLQGGLVLDLPSGQVTLSEEDVLVVVKAKEDFEASGSADAVVALHSEVDDDLRQEGLAREVVNRVQSLRKRIGLGYTDRIRLGISGDETLTAAVSRFEDTIREETLTVEVGAPEGDIIDDTVDGYALKLSIERTARV